MKTAPPLLLIRSWWWLPLGYTALSVVWLALWLSAMRQPLTLAVLVDFALPEVLMWNAWCVTTPLIVAMARRWSFSIRPLSWRWSAHLLLAPLVVLATNALGFGLTAAFHVAASSVGAPLGATLGDQMQSRMTELLTLGLPLGCIVYALIVALAQVAGYVERLRAEKEHSSALETQLARAELDALRMQLHPHFLFNTLNTISSTLHDDPSAADRMLTQLGDFLRLTLDHAHRAIVPLSEEVDFNRRYLRIEQHRLEDRLDVRVDVPRDVASAAVPYLLLQPLVENAIRHGIGQRVGAGTVTIRAAREGEELVVDVINTGPELSGEHRAGGIGLRNTRARLDQTYGHAASLTLGSIEGGVRARVRLPFAAYQASPGDGAPGDGALSADVPVVQTGAVRV